MTLGALWGEKMAYLTFGSLSTQSKGLRTIPSLHRRHIIHVLSLFLPLRAATGHQRQWLWIVNMIIMVISLWWQFIQEDNALDFGEVNNTQSKQQEVKIEEWQGRTRNKNKNTWRLRVHACNRWPFLFFCVSCCCCRVAKVLWLFPLYILSLEQVMIISKWW